MKRKQPTYFQRVYPLTLLTLTITICVTQQWLRTGSIVPQSFEVEAQGREQQAGVTAEIQTLSPTPTPTPTVVAEPTPAEMTQKQEIIAKIVEAFGEDAPDAFNVLYCENRGLNPNATNHNRNGTIDRGLFQINSIHGGEELFDIDTNIRAAKKIFDNRGWTAWACSERVGVTPFWKE